MIRWGLGTMGRWVRYTCTTSSRPTKVRRWLRLLSLPRSYCCGLRCSYADIVLSLLAIVNSVLLLVLCLRMM